LKPGDVIEVKPSSKKMDRILKSVEAVERRGLPTWVELDKEGLKATLKSKPERSELTLPITEQLIVELYSK
jgi:small subunit ribosomal protein S4